jgi:hypothetical protein
MEPPNLLPAYPTLRPADIGLRLFPKPVPMSETSQYLAIDITITASPILTAAAHDTSDEHTSLTPLQRVHSDSAKAKLNVPHASSLVHSNITLLPFTIDPLGGLGPFASRFLFSSSQLPLPTWTIHSFPTNPLAYDLVQRLHQFSPTNISDHATRNWQSGQPVPLRFGHSHNSFTPTQWITQTLALNISTALATHGLQQIARLLVHDIQQNPAHQRVSQHTPTGHTFSLRPPIRLPPQSLP